MGAEGSQMMKLIIRWSYFRMMETGARVELYREHEATLLLAV